MRRTNFSSIGLTVSLLAFSLTPALFNGGNVAFAAELNKVSPVDHTVSVGDTLWRLSETYHVPVKSLEKWNSLTDQSILQIGQRLVVGWSAAKKLPTYHRIVAGDTLSGLAVAHRVSLLQLEKWNGISSQSTLQIGQEIIVNQALATSGSWRHLKQLSYNGINNAGNENTGEGERFVAYADQFIGVPYVWGGESPSGFDCSGLVQYTLRHFGVSVPRTSYDQYLAGTPVDRQDLQPGDLVFFDTDGPGASHDGIYAGNGKFVNAAGGGVQIDSMNSGYWDEYYIGARRVR